MPDPLRRFIRLVLLVGVPGAAFIVTVTFSVALGRDNPAPAATPTLAVALPAPTATPRPPEPTAPPPTATPPPYRIDCAAIRGTAYRSDEERTWYLTNCR